MSQTSPAGAAVPAPSAANRHGKRDIRALTGLRAIAAMWVVLFHFEGLLPSVLGPFTFLLPVTNVGWIGVDLFFVLSGFVIAHNYIEECGRRWSTAAAARFVYNRFARIWPVWMVGTLVAVGWLLIAPHLGINGAVVSTHPAVTVPNVLRDLSMTQMWGRGDLGGASFDAPGWSISAEWAAYLAFPVLALLLRPLRRLHPLVNLVLATAVMLPLALPAYLHGTSDGGVSLNWLVRIGCCFVAGVLASLATRDLEHRPWRDRFGLALSVTSLVLVGIIIYWASWREGLGEVAGVHGIRYGLVSVFLWPTLVTGLALTDRGPVRWLSTPAMVYGGKVSYSLYMVHWVVRDVGMGLLWGKDPASVWVFTPKVGLLAPVLVLMCFGLAVAMHHLVEEPARRRLLALWTRTVGRRTADRQEAGGLPVVPVVPATRPAPEEVPELGVLGGPDPHTVPFRPALPRSEEPAPAFRTARGRHAVPTPQGTVEDRLPQPLG